MAEKNLTVSSENDLEKLLYIRVRETPESDPDPDDKSLQNDRKIMFQLSEPCPRLTVQLFLQVCSGK